jgi:hypothetical protein
MKHGQSGAPHTTSRWPRCAAVFVAFCFSAPVPPLQHLPDVLELVQLRHGGVSSWYFERLLAKLASPNVLQQSVEERVLPTNI